MKIQASQRFFSILAYRRFVRASRRLSLPTVLAAAFVTGRSVQAANTSHTINSGASGNVSDGTQYSAGGAPSSTTAGDILQDPSASAGFTLTVDVPVTIGTIKLNAGGNHTGTFSAGAGSFALDNTGGTVTNSFGNLDASIAETANAGSLTIGANIVAANSTLDIGTTQIGTVSITGNITASTSTTLYLRQNATQTSSTIVDTISGNIGATGSAIAINNASSGGGGNTKDQFTLSGTIGGASGIGAAVTITNAATGTSPFTISGALGASVSSITQNSGTSSMTLSGTSAGFAGTTSIQAGTLTLGGATVLADSAVTLSNTAGATLNVATASTIGSLTGGGTTGGNVTLGATLTTGGLNTNTTYSGTVSSTGGLIKVGTGTLTLNGTNTYTGTTSVNNGTLALDFTAASAPTTGNGILGNTTAGALSMGGGTLSILGATAASTQTFASTAVSSGGNVISAAPTAGGAIPTVNLGTLTGSASGLVRFNGAIYNSGASSGTTLGGTTVAATATYNATANTGTAGIISSSTSSPAAGYATVGAYDWAAISTGIAGTAQAGTVEGGSQIAGFYTTTNSLSTTSTFGTNIDLTASQTMFGNANVSGSYSTVRFNANAAITLTAARATGASVVGGLLVTPNVGLNNTTFAPNTGQSQLVFEASRSSNGATGLTVWQNDTQGELLVNAVYANGASSAATASYTQGGPGTVLLSAVNTYTGVTYLDGGATVINAFSGIGGGATPATLATLTLGGGTLVGSGGAVSTDFNSGVLRPVLLNPSGGGLAATTGSTLTVGGVISGTGPLTIGTGTLTGTGAGTANTTAVIGNGTVFLTGANTYTGATSVSAGTLFVNGNIGATATPAAAVTVSTGATLGGTGMLTVTSANVVGSLTPGAAVGATTGALTLNTTNGLTLSGGLVIGISGAGGTSISTNNLLTLSGATLMVNGTLNGTSNYDIANYGTLSGTFAGFTAPAGYTIDYTGTSFGTSDIELDVTAVPEPSTWAASLIFLGGVMVQQRRRLKSLFGGFGA